MGSGRYDQELARSAREGNRDVFASQEAEAQRRVHPILDAKGKIRECVNPTPIVLAMDVTRSRGDDSRIIYAKLPMFIEQIVTKNYVPGAALSFTAIGDASAGDKAPLQIGQFEADNRLDEALSKIWLEEGGGGSGQESYELAAYFFAHHSQLHCLAEGRKGFFFFLGDEGFYPKVSKAQISEILGREVEADLDSGEVFAALREKFHVFFVYPRKTMAERKVDIDAEIRKRVLAAGGRYEGVDIRASLVWNNRNDLDLHVIAPSGEHIFYAHKNSECGGFLDVDQNVRGETTTPVENVQWRRGTAPAGAYKVFVQNFNFHDPVAPTPFKVEIELNGEVQQLQGIISPEGETRAASDVTVTEFVYDPAGRPEEESHNEAYAGYSDEVILAQWSSVIPPENILQIDEPRTIIDVILGVLALVGGGASLDSVLGDMRERVETEMTEEQARRTLGRLAEAVAEKG